ncbi:diguanylate cyclase [Paenibacillus sp. TRM 82003]|uniref:diguanylate cyclase domain-containing protein n=1 Tax=Kineococcus sp. TRM81007 TaxID=2925831 RepID=UPI001F59C4B8|nr:diguanylate cyclase [Kineococcus sp. TRM81007]MCI2240383.1 diguanylate cyclase [Kineococcus sp. TRM81007]MCI3927441.1 diguanylate cyclase [Paenibacillus sp. TRM 82003]
MTTHPPEPPAPHPGRQDAAEHEPGEGTRLLVVHQPIVDLRNGDAVAVEGLVRGRRGAERLSPAQLFADAAACGSTAVLRLDEACLRHVAASAGGLPAGATLFVNVEPPTLAALSRRALAEVAAVVPAGVQVVVEVTERDLLQHPAQLLAGVRRVRELGWAVALDDVGAEPAALALMPFLRPEVIKLDLALVRARPSLDVAAVVNAVQAEAQRCGALVLAEGIETAEHLRRALSMGARLGQGWHFAHPGPPPQRWGAPLRLPPAPVVPSPAETVFEVLNRRVPAQPTAPDLLAALTRQVERQAMLLDETAVVLACFQDADSLTTATLRRYEALASVCSLTAVLGPGVVPEPAPGVHGTALHEDDPMSRQWVVTVVSPHFAAALAARDVTAPAAGAGPPGPAGGRPMEYVLSYERDQVVEAARLLMSRVQPPTGSTAAPGTAEVAGPPPGPGSAARQREGERPTLLGVPAERLPALLTRAIATASNGIVIADATAPDQPLVYVNAAFEELTGYSAEECLGRNCRFLQGPGTDPVQVRVIARRLLAGRGVRTTLLNHRRDGSTFWNEVTVSPVHDAEGRLTHFIGNQADVSDRVEREARTVHLAHHDVLTGLPNRAHLLDHLELELRRSARSGSGVAVVFIDLDGFKAVNDRFGHAAGDQALIHAAGRLRSVVRSGDLLGRLAGDEFLLVLTGLRAADVSSVRQVVQHLHDAVRVPVELPGGDVTLRASIGFALSPEDGLDATGLIDAADARMYRHKNVG